MMRRIFYFLKNYLGFTKRESKGFLLVVPSLFVLAFIPSILDWYWGRAANEKYEEYLLLVERKMAVKKGDLIFQDEEKGKLAPVSHKEIPQDTGRWTKPKKKEGLINKIDFAEADSSLLQIVPGIGNTLAGRIVKYREQLGGMHDKSQLLEVYGLKEEVARGIFEYFTFNPMVKNKIKLNQASVQDLARHPYVKYGEAKVIVAYREQHGDYQSPEDLLEIKIFTKDWLDRLQPYLGF